MNLYLILANKIGLTINNNSLSSALVELDALKGAGVIDNILGGAEIIEFPSQNGTYICKFVDFDNNLQIIRL